MTAFQRAMQVYERELSARSAEVDLGLHLSYGYLFNEPDQFIMGRAVDRHADLELIRDPSHVFPREEQNCWWIYLAATADDATISRGLVKSFFTFTPYPLEWLGWERGNSARFYPFTKIQRLWNLSSCSP